MKGLVPDVNIEGHFQALLQVFRLDPWAAFWNSLGLRTPTFSDLGWLASTSDMIVWQRCQQEELILVTGNRNAQGADSLEAAIITLNTPHSLPVITLASPPRIFHERSYAERAAVRILDYLLDMDRYRGTGRLYVP